VPLLDPARTARAEIRAGSVQRFGIPLAAGEHARVIVEQRGIDLVASLTDPVGRTLVESNDPGGEDVAETLSLVAETAGIHQLVVEALTIGAPTGTYSVRLEEVRPAVPQDGLRIAAERAESAAGLLLWKVSSESL
jgi:hypothetical protein